MVEDNKIHVHFKNGAYTAYRLRAEVIKDAATMLLGPKQLTEFSVSHASGLAIVYLSDVSAVDFTGPEIERLKAEAERDKQ